MKEKKKLLYAGGLLFVLGILGVLIVNTASSESPPPSVSEQQIGITPSFVLPQFVYSAKFVCGDVITGGEPVVPGTYRTAINVHNPQKTNVTLTKKAVLAFREGQWGPLSQPKRLIIPPDAAFEIDCPDIEDIIGISTPFTKGFVVITSPKELDVVGVYTAGGTNVESIDVETITPKKI